MYEKHFLLNKYFKGTVIDENALIYHLNNKNIKGAALDVFKSEPKINYKLKKMNNVILYPHHASSTYETRREMAELSIKNLIQYFKKENQYIQCYK